MTDDYTNAEIVRSLKRIEEKVDGIAIGYVPRAEYETRQQSIDRELKELKDAQNREADAQQTNRARVPAWAAVAVAAVALVVSPVIAALVAHALN